MKGINYYFTSSLAAFEFVCLVVDVYENINFFSSNISL